VKLQTTKPPYDAKKQSDFERQQLAHATQPREPRAGSAARAAYEVAKALLKKPVTADAADSAMAGRRAAYEKAPPVLVQKHALPVRGLDDKKAAPASGSENAGNLAAVLPIMKTTNTIVGTAPTTLGDRTRTHEPVLTTHVRRNHVDSNGVAKEHMYTVMKHREYVQDIKGTSTYSPGGFPLNVTNAGWLAWGSLFASLFDMWIPEKINFMFLTEESVATKGRIALVLDYDIADAAPFNKVQFYETNGVKAATAWQNQEIRASREAMSVLGLLFTGVAPAGSDPKFYAPANVFWMTQDCADTTVNGELWTDVEIWFLEPNLASAPGNNIATAAEMYVPAGTNTLTLSQLSAGFVYAPVVPPFANATGMLLASGSSTAYALATTGSSLQVWLPRVTGSYVVWGQLCSSATCSLQNPTLTNTDGGAQLTFHSLPQATAPMQLGAVSAAAAVALGGGAYILPFYARIDVSITAAPSIPSTAAYCGYISLIAATGAGSAAWGSNSGTVNNTYLMVSQLVTGRIGATKFAGATRTTADGEEWATCTQRGCRNADGKVVYFPPENLRVGKTVNTPEYDMFAVQKNGSVIDDKSRETMQTAEHRAAISGAVVGGARAAALKDEFRGTRVGANVFVRGDDYYFVDAANAVPQKPP